MRWAERAGASTQRCAPHISNKAAETMAKIFGFPKVMSSSKDSKNGGSPLEGLPGRTGKVRIRKMTSAFVAVSGSGRIMQVLRTLRERRLQYV